MQTTGRRWTLQEQQYTFPYHHIPHFTAAGAPSLMRTLRWGMEYLCYQHHAIERTRALDPTSVLEVGCGDGYFIGHLGHDIPTRHGVDLAEQAIQFAKAFHPEVHFAAVDAADLEKTYDAVVAIEVLEHIPDDVVPSFLQAVAARVRPGGHVMISVPTTVIPLKDKHFRHYTWPLLQRQITSHTDLQPVHHEFVYREGHLLRILRGVVHNSVYVLRSNVLNRLLWRYIWNTARFAGPADGYHLFATFTKA